MPLQTVAMSLIRYSNRSNAMTLWAGERIGPWLHRHKLYTVRFRNHVFFPTSQVFPFERHRVARFRDGGQMKNMLDLVGQENGHGLTTAVSILAISVVHPPRHYYRLSCSNGTFICMHTKSNDVFHGCPTNACICGSSCISQTAALPWLKSGTGHCKARLTSGPVAPPSADDFYIVQGG